MAKANIFISLFFIGVLLQSCSTALKLSSGRQVGEINNLLVLQPVAQIGLITIGNKPQPDMLLSKKAIKEIELQVKNLVPRHLRVSQLYTIKGKDSLIQSAINAIVNQVERAKDIRFIDIPETILNVLDSTKHDFCLCIAEVGFARSEENYNKQYDKGNMTQFVTLGMYGTVPYKSSSTMVCFIIDRKNNNIAFYGRDTWKETNPNERIVIKAHLDDLITRYFMGTK